MAAMGVQAAIAWVLGYGSLRICWALGAPPSPPPTGTDLVAFTGWWPVTLCGAAAAVLGLRTAARWRRPLAVAARAVTAALAAAGALVLLDVVGLLPPGIGVAVHPGAVLSRAVCLTGAVTVGATALCNQCHWRGAWLAAWAAVAGCLAVCWPRSTRIARAASLGLAAGCCSLTATSPPSSSATAGGGWPR